MSDWVDVDTTSPRAKEWLHVPTGVVLFVRDVDDGYGVCIRATSEGPVDSVSIGDAERGLFRRFDERERAVRWADEWKESDAVLKALEAADSSGSTNSSDSTDRT